MLVALAAGFPLAPKDLKDRVAQAFDQLNHTPMMIEAAIEILEDLMEECRPMGGSEGSHPENGCVSIFRKTYPPGPLSRSGKGEKKRFADF